MGQRSRVLGSKNCLSLLAKGAWFSWVMCVLQGRGPSSASQEGMWFVLSTPDNLQRGQAGHPGCPGMEFLHDPAGTWSPPVQAACSTLAAGCTHCLSTCLPSLRAHTRPCVLRGLDWVPGMTWGCEWPGPPLTVWWEAKKPGQSGRLWGLLSIPLPISWPPPRAV